jgi:DNA polymerase-3 subunit epsilon
VTDDSWVALDFETATRERSSACSIGVAVIEDGVLSGAGSWLIQPPGNVYETGNTWVHGIHEDLTAQSPAFSDLYPTLWPYLNGRHVLAHWASFDISVLRSVIEHYELPSPDLRYACSCRMAQRSFPELDNHRLSTVCTERGIPLEHHDAGSDALACAMVALQCRDHIGARTIQEAIDKLGLSIASL